MAGLLRGTGRGCSWGGWGVGGVGGFPQQEPLSSGPVSFLAAVVVLVDCFDVAQAGGGDEDGVVTVAAVCPFRLGAYKVLVLGNGDEPFEVVVSAWGDEVVDVVGVGVRR